MKTVCSQEFQKTSLIIDDEQDICYLLGNILAMKNIKNCHVNDLAGGRRKIEEEDFDIIFLDNHLPDGRGADIAPYVKQLSPRTKIIMITAFEDFNSADEIRQHKIDRLLLKPLNTESINEAVDSFFIDNNLNSALMKKFIISFSINDKEYTAAVTKSVLGNRIDYSVRPTSPIIIQKFGPEVLIFREDENFTVNTSRDEYYKDYVDALTTALKRQDLDRTNRQDNPNQAKKTAS